MDEIANILPSLFRKQIRRDEPHLVEILAPLWPRIAGRTIAHHSQISLFSGGVLTLSTEPGTWTTQLRFMSGEILKQINDFLGQPVVKKLRITTVTQRDLFAARQQPREHFSAPRPRAVQPMDTSPIADQAIAHTLANSYAKYFNRPQRKLDA